MTDEDAGAEVGEQEAAELDYLDIPMINRMRPDTRDDENGCLSLLRYVCRCRSERDQEEPSIWSRLRRWISAR